MKKSKSLIIALAVVFFVAACSTVAVTDRKQLKLIPNGTLYATSFLNYKEFLDSNKVVQNTPDALLVKKVGTNIQKAVEKYFADKGMGNKLSGYKWEFNLVQNQQINAWAMPGGKVVFYTGILPITKNEDGIAVVMGHEIAHIVAEHGNERMSQQLVVQMGGMALNEAIKNKPEQTKALWMTTFGIGAQYGAVLPYSRLHENEADELGLIFMAMAGYNPEKAVDFWTRMSQMSSGQKPPEFLSTHPSDETRIKNMKEKLPKALEFYKK
jgi:predicted Zn-dependent protease